MMFRVKLMALGAEVRMVLGSKSKPARLGGCSSVAGVAEGGLKGSLAPAEAKHSLLLPSLMVFSREKAPARSSTLLP
jgi:hypothetical protein